MQLCSCVMYMFLVQIWFKKGFLAGILDLLQKPVVAFVRLSDTVVMESVLESSVPIRFVFMMVGPSHSDVNYTQTGRAMATEGPKEDPLARTGYPFGGMVKDIKRRYRHYLSDYIDAVNPQVLAAIIFIYFAALSPAITFGGLLELMVSTCVQGVIFCIIAAQPILIIGFSGPLLLFEEAFFAVCASSQAIRFLKMFSKSCSPNLNSLTHPLILNYEHVNDTLDNPFHPVIKKHVEIHPDGNVTVQDLEVERPYPNTALLSMCLMFGCFFIAYFLRQFKNGTFLPGPVRSGSKQTLKYS
ncbi:hypothetical protein XENOCAPTIV_027550 [Xenoophorus captivus]|uniref:Uncharacterized protein n=1 Tax=Xenoophorus captivus TaxID=1517983 RepID=A0ABV0S5Z5_9TELE